MFRPGLGRPGLARLAMMGPLLAPLLALSACGGNTNYARTFGLSRDAPDEFTVTTRAPLSMPPEFALRPPTPGEDRPQELSQRQQAADTLVPSAALTNGGGPMSPGQEAILQQAGPAAPANIRGQVDQAAIAAASPTLTERLMFWKSTQPGTVVDPSKETQRLQQNAALGQSPLVGNTPIIQKPNSGFLGNLF
jgi:Protein of unknown function (DUF3035)